MNFQSSRLINYEDAENISLSKKLNEIKFPQRVPNSPYAMKNITPATPISMMMELKNWLKSNIAKVTILPHLSISTTTFNCINPPSDEDKL